MSYCRHVTNNMGRNFNNQQKHSPSTTMSQSRIKYHLVYILFCLICACQPSEHQQQTAEALESSPSDDSTVKTYPEDLIRVLDAHGGLDQWRKMNSLSFEIVKDQGNEKHFIQLQDRRDRVEAPNVTMGFDGGEVWMEADTTYKGDPEFYHNLMFYFYAMPFVLADDGINYGSAEPLEVDGIAYPGISISYHDGVGSSPKDEYLLYYHPDSFKMEWLGYTVTYFSGEASEDVHWIRYTEWEEFEQLKLPVAITWYNYQEGLPTEPRNRVAFENIDIGTDPFPDDIFEGP